MILRNSASFCSLFSPSKGLVLQNVWAQERTVLEYSGSLQNIGAVVKRLYVHSGLLKFWGITQLTRVAQADLALRTPRSD